MADNETNIGNPSVDVDIIPKVVSLEQSMAQLVRSFAELKPVIYARVAIDREVTGGVGEQVQRAVDEATKHLQFAFSGLLKSNTDIRTLEDSLRSMMTVSEEAGQKLQAVFTAGARGGPQFKISTAQDVGPALEAMQRHRADFPAEQMRLRVGGSALDQARYGGAALAFSGITEPAVDKELQREREATIKATAAAAKVEADLARARLNTIAKEQEEHTKAQGSFGAGWDKAALAEKQQLFREEKIEADINIRQKLAEVAASKALVEAKRNELNLAQRIGAGQPLRRAIAPAITGALGGSDAAAITGGIMAMVMQSMIFRIGWGAMGLAEQGAMGLAKLPNEVMQANLNEELELWRRKKTLPNESSDAGRTVVRGTNTALYRVLHDTNIPAGIAQTSMEQLATITGDYDVAFDRAVQFAAIATAQGVDPATRDKHFTALMAGYGHLKESGDVKGIGAFIDANPELRREMRKSWEAMRPRASLGNTDEEKAENKDIAFQDYLNSGRIGPRLLDKLIRNVAVTDYPALQAMQSAGMKPLLYGETGSKYPFLEHSADQEAYLKQRGIEKPEIQTLYPYYHHAGTGEYYTKESLPGVTGGTTPLSIEDERKNVKGHFYQFSSITGLAEQMQMMASGGGIPEQQLSEAQKQTALQTDMRDELRGRGTVQHAPLGRMLSIEGPAG